MAFTLFKEEYTKRMNDGPFFETTDETAEFISTLYDDSIKGGVSTNGGTLLTGNKAGLVEQLKIGLSSEVPSLLFFESQLSLGLLAYWTAGVLTNGSTVVTPGLPIPPNTFSNADTIEDFLGNFENAFSIHYSGAAGMLGTTPWAGYNVP
jgi:hypothetical protein|tara:strand:+ start:2823 stop:3272 length:450 start_codon:yes stop_codon:yes gene_type:complete